MSLYTTKEVAIMLNITKRTVRYYDNEQVVEASVRKNTRRYYDRDKVTELFVVLFLKNLGYSLSKIKEEMAQTDTIQALFSYAIEYKEFKISEDINMIKNVKALMRYYTKNNVSSIQDMSRLEQSKSDKLEQHLSPVELNIVRNISKIQETYQIGSAWPALIEKIKITHDYRGHVDEWFESPFSFKTLICIRSSRVKCLPLRRGMLSLICVM